jgi:sigma-B regulation protein RsbU (phosphoserine phosphatase)
MAIDHALHAQLLDRRNRLQVAVTQEGEAQHLVRLLREVDDALDRIRAGTYGTCDICREKIEDQDLRELPLLRYCLCALSPEQLDALSSDLDLAWRIQAALLPRFDLRVAGWEPFYRYEPVGPVSGDYCDLLASRSRDGELFFVVGDVSGKGVAAALLMAHLNALFRSLIDTELLAARLVERANRLLLESTLSTHYATLVCGWARSSGELELCNAGHCPPLVVRAGDVEPIASTGAPIGMLSDQVYAVHKTRLEPGDSLVLYTDGLTEARNAQNEPYEVDRLVQVLEQRRSERPRALARACLEDQRAFLAGAPKADDLTLLVLQRASA